MVDGVLVLEEEGFGPPDGRTYAEVEGGERGRGGVGDHEQAHSSRLGDGRGYRAPVFHVLCVAVLPRIDVLLLFLSANELERKRELKRKKRVEKKRKSAVT